MKILNTHSIEVLQRLGLPVQRTQLSMPVDGKEPRIKVSLRPGSKIRVPSRLTFELDGRNVQVPLEAAEDYQTYSLQ
jgi:hypothetical protein